MKESLIKLMVMTSLVLPEADVGKYGIVAVRGSVLDTKEWLQAKARAIASMTEEEIISEGIAMEWITYCNNKIVELTSK